MRRGTSPATADADRSSTKGVIMIYEYLKQVGAIGAENAISQKDLCAVFGMNSAALKETIRNERKNGKLIIGDSHGYYIAATRAEIEAFYNSMKSAAISRFETLKVFRDALRSQDEQADIMDYLEDTNSESVNIHQDVH